MKIFDSIRKLSKAIGSRITTAIDSNRQQTSAIAKSMAIGSIRLLAIAFVLSASAAIETSPNWTESEPPIRFKSRDWADAVLAAASTNSSIAIEGGRLLSNATWSGERTHLVFNTVYVPSGITLTIFEGAVVKFCPGTMIKVEDGGKLSIVGASGNDVILTAAHDATVGAAIAGLGDEPIAFDGIRLQSSGATFTDNSHLETRGFNYGAFPTVSVGGTEALRNGGIAYIPFTLSGSSRETAFSVEWEAIEGTAKFGDDYTLASGTISWAKSSEGTKTLQIPLNATNVTGEERTFTVRIKAARCSNIGTRTATVKIVERDALTLEWASDWTESEPSIRFKSRDWADAVLATASTNDAIAIEGGRLLTNTTWSSERTHLVFNTVYVPSGVTLTISEGAVVKFCPGTMIKVEDGGKLNVVGASGNDVILTAANDATVGEVIAGFTPEQSIAFDGIRLQSSAATFTDNGWLETRGFNYGAYPSVTLNDSTAFRSSGLASIPVTISGTRDQTLMIDWVAEDITAKYGEDYTLASGRITWGKASEGTKTISIPLVTTNIVGATTSFKIKIVTARGANIADGECTVSIREFDTLNIDSASAESMPPIRFKSRDWADAVLAAASTNSSIAIEGGRLLSNTTWDATKTHLVFNTVYVPSGITLTISEGAVVKFCPGTMIKVEDGGKLSIVGVSGNDVILTAANDATVGEIIEGLGEESFAFDGIRLQSTAATFTDNGWIETRGFSYGAYPSVTLHDATANRKAGMVYLPVTVGGTTRNQSFTVDWVAEDESAQFGRDYVTHNSGRITWSKSGDGTKYITIPLVTTENAGSNRTFKVRFVVARGVNVSRGEATVTIAEFAFYGLNGQPVEITTNAVSSTEFAIKESIGSQPIFLNDVEQVRYSGKWQAYDQNDAAALRITVDSDNGTKVLKECSVTETGSFELRQADYATGFYTLKHEILNNLGETLATMKKSFSIVDTEDVELHGGILTKSEVWSADKVHVVYETVTVPAAYTLFIEPGAIVKFMTGTGIDISQGGALFANKIVFTHINDDTIGGDTLSDGYTVAPPMDAYTLSGNFTFGDDTELRGITQNNALTGTISTRKVLSRGSTYRVSGTLTIANGSSLTIPPGTVLKMESGASIVVNSGATLTAVGTRAAPIIITSIKDDSVSGDTNGDGDKTIPQPGDWVKIGINGGTANFEFTSILYSSKNQTTGAININGGTVVFNNSEIAHGMYDAVGVESGHFYMTNSVIRDCLLAFRHWAKDPIVNSVIYDCGRLTQGGGQHFVNCIFSRITETWEAFGFPQNGTTYDNCCFWNEGGSILTAEGKQDAMTVCGKNGNIWGDPLFVDPDNGDFRIEEGSPCVDAADSSVAPEFDYYGQPRITVTEQGTNTVGQLADIGICEVMPRNVTSDIDLVPQNVRTVTNAVPGELLFVKWEVKNAGGNELEGAWRDTISLISNNGREIQLGVKTTTGVIAPGGSIFCSGYFTVPPISEGEWYPKVNVNSYRDVFEGALGVNNALVGDRALIVMAEALDPSVAREGVIGGGTPSVIKLTFGADDENRMVKFDVPAGVKVTWGFGFMPQGASQSGSMTAADGGVMFRVPEGATDVYVVLESDKTATYEMMTESTKMVITGVTPNTLPSSGTTTLVITGAGFGDTNVVVLASDSVGRVVLNAPQKDASGNLIATVDCSTLTAGATYGVRVESGEKSAELHSAVTVTKAEGKGHFWARLVVPESVRQGRKVTCYVEYGNDGNADIPCQVVQVSMRGNGILKYISDLTTGFDVLQFVATGDFGSAGILRSGSCYKIFFLLEAGDINTLELCTSYGQEYSPDMWGSKDEYLFALSTAASRLSMQGRNPNDFYGCMNLACNMLTNSCTSSICGSVLSKDPMNTIDAIPIFAYDEHTSNTFYSVVRQGNFIIYDVLPGRYTLYVGSFGNKLAKDIVVQYNHQDLIVNLISNIKQSVIVRKPSANADDIQMSARSIDSANVYVAQKIENEVKFAFYGLAEGDYNIEIRRGSDICAIIPIEYKGELIEIDFTNELSDVAVLDVGLPVDVFSTNVICYVISHDNSFFEGYVFSDMSDKLSLELPRCRYSLIVVNLKTMAYELLEDINLSTGNKMVHVTISNQMDMGKFSSQLVRAGTSIKPDPNNFVGDYQFLYEWAGEVLSRPIESVPDDRKCVHNIEKYERALEAKQQLEFSRLNFKGLCNRYAHLFGLYIASKNAAFFTTTASAIAAQYGIGVSLFQSWCEAVGSAQITVEDLGSMLRDVGLDVIDNEVFRGNISLGNVVTIYGLFKRYNIVFKHELEMLKAKKAVLEAMPVFLGEILACERAVAVAGPYFGCCKEPFPNPPYDPPVTNKTLNPVVSIDPNEMSGPLGLGDPNTERFVKPGEWMTYTVYFENMTNATAAAQEVYVTNPLSEWLDWSTFEMGEVSFGNQIDLGLSGKSSGSTEKRMDGTNWIVRTELSIEPDTTATDSNRQQKMCAKWYLRIVDPSTNTGWPNDPVAGFLPPNNPETHCGEGHLTYRIKLRDDAPGNVVITNSATIVFDYNEPITTDPAWWNTVAPTEGVAKFSEADILAEEGTNVAISVFGGNAYNTSSVKLYLTYNTAAAADIDLKNGTVDSSTGGSPVVNAQAARSTNLKFPLMLTWAAGEIGEKTITIPVLADKAIEDAEQFTLQLADPVGMELGVTRLCTVTITDPGYAELEAKIAAGTATKAEKTAWDKLQKAKAPYIRAVADPANAGKVTGSGLCASGKKVTLKATANKGYVFTGWLKEQIALDGDRLVTNAVEYIATTPSLVLDRTAKPAKDTATSTTLTNVNDNATFYAAFITTDEDKAAVGLTLNGGEVSQSEGSVPSLTTNIMCGVALNWPLASSALSATTVKVAGLPAGLKFTAKDIMKKGSKTEVEIPANTIYGVPTAASKIDKKTGLPVPSAVKVTVTTAGKSSVTYLMNITVDALPAWAVGNFEGFVRYDENDGGFATMSITAAGKVSGKIAYGGTNWTFKADSYDITSETVGSTNFIVETVAVSGKATRNLWMTITDIGRDYLPDSAVAFVDGNFGDMLTEMHRLPWKDKNDDAAAALVASYAGAYSCTMPYGEDAGDVTFILDEKGMVKGTVVLPDGAKTRKATFSSNALTGDSSLLVVIALPPDAKKGYPAVFKVVNLVNHSGEDVDNLAFRDPGVVAAVAELTAESGATGTVSVNPKYGQVAPGKDVTLTAKAAKGSVFHRWEITGVDTEGLDLSSATLKFKMADAGDVFATAVFVTADEDAASIALSVDALGGEISPEAIISVTNTCGVALKWSVAADALSQPTVAVSGLPAGLKFTAKDIMKKGSKTEVEIPANTIYGAPTAESKLDAKTGLRKPSAVKFTVTTAGKSKRVYLVDMTVLPLPDWAVGTFNGGGDLGQVSLTVAKTGKLSGKYLSEGFTWSLAADSFDSIDESGDVYRATLIGKSGKLVMTNEIGVACDLMGGFVESIDYIAYQNNWKLEPWKSVGKPFAKAAALEYKDSASVAGVSVPGVLSLKFAASGAVTVKGSFITGINEKTGKEILYSASGTAVLAPQREPDANGAFDAVVFVYLPPKAGKFDGYVRCIGVRWTGEGWFKQ